MTHSRENKNGIQLIESCRQSSHTTLGTCYGYARVWAEVGDRLFESVESTVGDTIVLQLTKKIKHTQWGQCWANTQRSVRPYLFDSGLTSLVDVLATKLTLQNTALILAHGLFYGHCLGLKRISNGYRFFDCNNGEYEFASLDVFKNWLPTYLNKAYHGYYYLFNYEIASPQGASALTRIQNMGKFSAKLAMKFVLSPIGIFRTTKSVTRLFESEEAPVASSYKDTLLPLLTTTNEPPSSSSPLTLTQAKPFFLDKVALDPLPTDAVGTSVTLKI